MRAVVALFVMALLFTAFGEPASPAAGADLTDRISSARTGQSYFEQQMRQQDRIVARLERRGDKLRRKLGRATRIVKRTVKRYKAASKAYRSSNVLLQQALDRFPDPSLAPDPENWSAKLERLQADVEKAVTRQKGLGKWLRRASRNRNAKLRQVAQHRRERKRVLARRNRAEGALAAQIVRMTSLAQQRADIQSSIRLTSDGSTFAWPSEGRISQAFGCTGFRLNPRRGSCRHFHDGIDIVSSYGSPVRAAAIGVVAYVGWNPWDEGSRAFIVVVGHPDGFVTRYGHLVPSRKVRAGQLVRKGQSIGKMGSTGNSTGTHLHMELLRYTTPLNPVAYMPDGVVEVKHAKKAKKAKQAKQAKRAKAAAKRKSARQRQQARRRDRQREATRPTIVDSSGSNLECPVLPGVTAVTDTMFTESGIEIRQLPGIDAVREQDDSEATGCGQDQGVTHGSNATAARPVPATKAAAMVVNTADGDARAVRLPLRGTSPVPQ